MYLPTINRDNLHPNNGGSSMSRQNTADQLLKYDKTITAWCFQIHMGRKGCKGRQPYMGLPSSLVSMWLSIKCSKACIEANRPTLRPTSQTYIIRYGWSQEQAESEDSASDQERDQQDDFHRTNKIHYKLKGLRVGIKEREMLWSSNG